MFKQAKVNATREYLCEPILSIGWRMEYTHEQQETAYLALYELLRRLNSKRVKRHIPLRDFIDHGYLRNLYEAKKALDRQNYCLACNELTNVLYLYCSAQTVAVVRDMLQSYLEYNHSRKRWNRVPPFP